MSILVSLLQLLSFAFGGATFETQGPRFDIEKSDLITLEGPGPVNPCAAGCR